MTHPPTASDPDGEIYPMPSFVTLTVRDVQASATFYTTVLGFRHIFTMPGPTGSIALVHLRWVRYADLLLVPDRLGVMDASTPGVGVAINFTAPEVDGIAERATAAGATVRGPVEQPWNVRELTVLDPDGYRLVFNGEPIGGRRRSFDEILANAAKGPAAR